jgi:hypothetical protein
MSTGTDDGIKDILMRDSGGSEWLWNIKWKNMKQIQKVGNFPKFSSFSFL